MVLNSPDSSNPSMAPPVPTLAHSRGVLIGVIAAHAVAAATLATFVDRAPLAEPVTIAVTLLKPAPEQPPADTPPRPLPQTPQPRAVKPAVQQRAPEPEPLPQPAPIQQVEANPEPPPPARPMEPPPAPAVEPVQNAVAPLPVEPVPQRESTPPPPLAQAAPPVQTAMTATSPQREEPLYSAPLYSASYLDNPTPAYPQMSLRLREQGTVLLRVLVTARGDPGTVELKKSCGYARLDRLALDTVKRWKFVPAKRGDRAVDEWLEVPIRFVLKG
jgi:protein TonB